MRVLRPVALIAIVLLSSRTAAAQDRIRQVAAIAVDDTVVTIWASSAGLVLVRIGRAFGAPEVRLSSADSGLSIDGTAQTLEKLGLHPTAAEVRQTRAAIAATARYASMLANGRDLPSTEHPYFEFQVDKPATEIGNARLEYPPMLRSAHVEGNVLAQFVVDTLGHVELDSFKVLKSSHDLFTNALRLALPAMRFEPAMLAGRKVRQLVQKPYHFRLSQAP